MKKSFALSSALLLGALSAAAAPTLYTGTPNLGSMTAASGTQSLSPRFGILINFEDLTSQVTSSTITNAFGMPQSLLPAVQYAADGVKSISDPSGLYATFGSQQSYPIWLMTDSGTTDTTITLSKPTNIIGIGLGGDGSTPVTLEALGAGGSVLGDFTGLVPNSATNPDNAYYVITDTTNDIQSLVITSSQSLGMDDLQFAPEPSTFALMGVGALLVFSRLRKRAS